MVLEQDENKRLIAKPYNAAEIQAKDEEMGGHSMATHAMLTQQQPKNAKPVAPGEDIY